MHITAGCSWMLWTKSVHASSAFVLNGPQSSELRLVCLMNLISLLSVWSPMSSAQAASTYWITVKFFFFFFFWQVNTLDTYVGSVNFLTSRIYKVMSVKCGTYKWLKALNLCLVPTFSTLFCFLKTPSLVVISQLALLKLADLQEKIKE